MSNVAEKAAVKRGIAFLNKADRGWENCIDLDTFNLERPCCCVIGQVYVEEYNDACALLGIEVPYQQAHFGFDTCWEAPDLDYPGLEEEWKRHIKAKQRGR